jgi:hypothetical protein
LDVFSIAIIVLEAKTNRLADLGRLVPRLMTAIEFARPGAPNLVEAD